MRESPRGYFSLRAEHSRRLDMLSTKTHVPVTVFLGDRRSIIPTHLAAAVTTTLPLQSMLPQVQLCVDFALLLSGAESLRDTAQ
jgi:hypothetical protein